MQTKTDRYLDHKLWRERYVSLALALIVVLPLLLGPDCSWSGGGEVISPRSLPDGKPVPPECLVGLDAGCPR